MTDLREQIAQAFHEATKDNLVEFQSFETGYEAGWQAARIAVIEECCTAIKSKDDLAADDDYMLDSNDCIKVCRALKSQQDAAIETKPAEQKDSTEIEALRLLYREAVYWRSMQSWSGKVALKKAIAAVDAAIESRRSGDGS